MLEVIVALTLLLTNAGESQKEIVCSLELVKIESNYHLHSVNTKSGAYGLFQLMKISKTIPIHEQVDRYLKYLKRRYSGNSCKALQHLHTKGWY